MTHCSLSIAVLLALKSVASFGQSPENDNTRPPYQLIGKNRPIHRMVSLDVVDDFVPYLKLGANDEGYTVGTFIGLRLPNPKRNYYFDVSFSSKLYTRAIPGTVYRRTDGLIVAPQYFVETSFLSLSFSKYYPQKEFMIHGELGGGVYNQYKPIPMLSLWLQGGDDGKKGFHNLLGKQQSRQDNIPTGGIQANFYGQFSVEKFYFFNKRREKQEAAYISVEPGMRVMAPILEGSSFFLTLHNITPLVRKTTPTNNLKFRLAALANAELLMHKDGFLFSPELGFEMDIFLMRIGYTVIFPRGPQQDSYTHYNDSDPLMRVYAQFSF